MQRPNLSKNVQPNAESVLKPFLKTRNDDLRAYITFFAGFFDADGTIIGFSIKNFIAQLISVRVINKLLLDVSCYGYLQWEYLLCDTDENG